MKITPTRRAQFLEVLAATCSVAAAARAARAPGSAGGRASWYRLRESDPKFAAAWAEAVDTGIATLETEAHRRAVEGTREPIINGKGEQIGERVRHSDNLLLALLKAHSPEFQIAKHEIGLRGELTPEIRAAIAEAVRREAPEPLPRVTAADLANAPTDVEAFLSRVLGSRRRKAEAPE